MKVCIFGAGAIGGHVAARLIAAKAAEVSVVTRGAQLEAIRSRGLTLHSGGQEISGKPAAATADPSTLLPQDVVLVTLKAHSLPGAAAANFSNILRSRLVIRLPKRSTRSTSPSM